MWLKSTDPILTLGAISNFTAAVTLQKIWWQGCRLHYIFFFWSVQYWAWSERRNWLILNLHENWLPWKGLIQHIKAFIPHVRNAAIFPTVVSSVYSRGLSIWSQIQLVGALIEIQYTNEEQRLAELISKFRKTEHNKREKMKAACLFKINTKLPGHLSMRH